jgi:hypothetical protein
MTTESTALTHALTEAVVVASPADTAIDAVRAAALAAIAHVDTLHGVIRALPDGENRVTWLADLVEQQSPAVRTALETVGGAGFPLGAGAIVDGLVGSFVADDGALPEAAEAPGPARAAVQAWLDRPLGDAADRAFTADVTVAVLPWAARALGATVDVGVVATAVDLGMNAAKAAYRVASGQASLAEGLDWVADRAAAAVGSLVERAVDEHAGNAGEWLGAALGQLVGMAPMGRVVGRRLGELVGPAVAKVVRQGVETLTRATVRTVLRGVEAAANTVKRLLFG